MLLTKPYPPGLSRRDRTILVPVAILALGSLLALGFLMMVRVAKAQAEARTQIARFKTALQLYMIDNGQPPTAQQGLDALVHRPTAPPRPVNWKNYLPELSVIPKDPWGQPYDYQSPGPNGDDYFVASYGADGRPGGLWAAEDRTSADPP